MPRKKVSCINETRMMKNGMKATCIAYREYKDMDIQFEDGTIVKTQKVHFYNGDTWNPNSLYNPYRKLEPLSKTNPELMKQWDYEKNKGIDPRKITTGSGTYVNWKCHFCGHEWRSRVNNRSSNKRGCPNCTMKSTSFGEQSVFFYVKKLFPKAINRYKDGKFELDIFVPNIKTAIEFDGAFFHKGTESDLREKRKFERCHDLGIRLIRIKDSSELKNRFAANFTIGVKNLQSYESLNNATRLLLRVLASKWGISNPCSIPNQIDCMVDVDRDYFEIVENKYLI